MQNAFWTKYIYAVAAIFPLSGCFSFIEISNKWSFLQNCMSELTESLYSPACESISLILRYDAVPSGDGFGAVQRQRADWQRRCFMQLHSTGSRPVGRDG